MWGRAHNYYHVLNGLTKTTAIIKIKNHTICNNNVSLEGEMLGYSGSPELCQGQLCHSVNGAETQRLMGGAGKGQ